MSRSAAILWAVAVGAVALGVACAPGPEPERSGRGDVSLQSDTESVDGRVPRHATLASLLRASRLREDLVDATVSIARRVFEPRRLRADHAYHLERTRDGLLRSFEYDVDGERYLRIAGPPGRQAQDLQAEMLAYRKEHALVSVRGEISDLSPSLFAAMDALGEGPDLSVALADVFSGEIDFSSELQPGDTFRLTFEKTYREGVFAGYGAIVAAEFENAGRILRAIRYTLPGGKPGYYDEQGRSLRRFFLKSPLKFAAPVTSRFSLARFHPILRIVRPHFGVDYKAPAGAPVVAAAVGTVVSAGWNGEGGQLVHLRHPSGYETFYMHLSSISVKAGARVGQGDLIGRVGMTGLATGPHLDYRVKKDGQYVNPLSLHRTLPPGDPIPAGALGQFHVDRDRVLATLVAPVSGWVDAALRPR